MDKIATRVSYGQALLELAKEDKNVIALDADLAEATKSNYVKKELPEQFVECGIAEGNMMSVAAGLATMGLIPFASSFAMFAAGRAYDAVRNTIGYPGLNVKIGATHAGISVGEDGASHQCCEDVALMRSIPGMVVLSPSDHIEAKACVKAAYEHKGPVYMRFSRYATEVFHNDDYQFSIGKGELLKDGTDLAVICAGIITYNCLQAVRELEEEGLHIRLINMCSIKPIDEDMIIQAAKDCHYIVTVEEHSTIGGLGEAVSGVVAENYPVPVHKIGVPDVFGHSGPAAKLLEEFKLSKDELKKQFLHYCEINNK